MGCGLVVEGCAMSYEYDYQGVSMSQSFSQSNLMRDEALQDDIYQEYQGPYQDSYEIQEYQEEHDANNSADITGKIW
ncbi:hypothetical protein M8J75_011791 [Diaphorina citri]|nr:hypothetical protein M8J75_011791 [Diaphorina citri]